MDSLNNSSLGLNYYLDSFNPTNYFIPYKKENALPQISRFIRLHQPNNYPLLDSPNYPSYKNNPSIKEAIIKPTLLSSPLYESILPILEEVNSSLYKLNLTHISDLKFVTYNKGKGFIDFHQDIGDSHHSNRKLTFIVPISKKTKNYEGGDLEILDNNNNSKLYPLKWEEMCVFPSFLMNRITPVTKGKLEYIIGYGCGSSLK